MGVGVWLFVQSLGIGTHGKLPQIGKGSVGVCTLGGWNILGVTAG